MEERIDAAVVTAEERDHIRRRDVQEVRNQIKNAPDPFVLQKFNNPGVFLVSVPLNGVNYLTWSRSMTLALLAKGKLGFINGSVQVPVIGSFEHEK